MSESELSPEVDVDATLVEKAKTLERNALSKKAPASDAKPQLSLDLFPDDTRATPNVLLRSAVFGVLAKRKRELATGRKTATSARAQPAKKTRQVVAPRPLVNDLEIPCLDSARYRIFFTGELLDQADRDVYELLIYLCKAQPIGTNCLFSSNNFLKLIDRPNSKAGYDWLEDSFKRLLKATIVIYQLSAEGEDKKLFGGHFVDALKQDSATKKWTIRLGPELYALYTQGARFTYYPVEHRLPLKGQPLASWLQGFFCTHVTSIPVSLDALVAYSGSENKSLSGFKQKVTNACKKLKSIGIFESYGWQGQGASSKLVVAPMLNKSQQAWVRKKEAKALT